MGNSKSKKRRGASSAPFTDIATKRKSSSDSTQSLTTATDFDKTLCKILPGTVEYQQIVKMCTSESTWPYHKSPGGRDAVGLANIAGMQITSIHKCKSPGRFALKYDEQIAIILQKAHHVGLEQCLPIEETIGETPIATKEMEITACPRNEAVNEYFMFHGTDVENVDKIFADGFKIGKQRGTLYGNGIYLAEHAQKADQYADDRTGVNRRMKGLTIIICRALLGRSYIRKDTGDGGSIQMPCFKSGCFTHGCGKHMSCDSIVAGYDKNFREFLLYNENQVMPIYVVTYDRIVET